MPLYNPPSTSAGHVPQKGNSLIYRARRQPLASLRGFPSSRSWHSHLALEDCPSSDQATQPLTCCPKGCNHYGRVLRKLSRLAEDFLRFRFALFGFASFLFCWLCSPRCFLPLQLIANNWHLHCGDMYRVNSHAAEDERKQRSEICHIEDSKARSHYVVEHIGFCGQTWTFFHDN